MSLVNRDWQTPSRWLRARISWGAVVDGDTIRLTRMTAGGEVESVQEPLEAFTAGSDLRTRVEKDRARGALIVVGLEPHRLMIRELTSPLSDPRKAEDIWLTLFDATIPFPLESCRVVLLARDTGPEGVRCLAAGVRKQDLESLREEWKSRGLEPDLVVPEPLLVSPDRQSRVWCGAERTVWSFWRDAAFLGAGGLAKIEARDKTLVRQSAALEVDLEQVERVGPGGASGEDWLERGLARAALRADSLTVNVCDAESASPQLRTRWERRVRQVRILGLTALLLAVVLPFLPAHRVWMQRQAVLEALSTHFETLAGYSAPPGPPGHELALGRRVVEQEWGLLREAMARVERPGAPQVLAATLDTAREHAVQVAKVDLAPGRLDLRLRGDADAVQAFVDALRSDGWKLEPLTQDGDDWVVGGDRP